MHNDSPQLSIIIPVYGVEKYVEDCILSCIENIGSNAYDVEVVVVDDGSKDRSIEIVRSLIVNYSYFHIITQENQGLSMARNNGIEVSRGEYVWFIDPDDFIAKGVIEEILKVIRHYETIDMIELQYEEVDEFINRNTIPHEVFQNKNDSCISGRQRLLTGFYSPVPFHVFRKSFLLENNLRMFPGIYHEDGEFTPRALWLAGAITTLNGTAYYYRQRRNSIMSTTNPKKGEDNIFVSNRLKDFFDNQCASSMERKIINNFIAMVYCNGLHSAIGAKSEDRKCIDTAAYQYRRVLKSLRNAGLAKYRVLGFLATLCPKHITDLYLFLMRFNSKH